MSRKRNREFKEKLANELRGIGEVLLKFSLIRDVSPLLSAASMCTRSRSLERPEWSYSCSNLNFRLNADYLKSYKRTIPGNLWEVGIELSVDACGACIDQPDTPMPIDPFTLLEVNCVIEGKLKNSAAYYFAWHLDRNQGGDKDSKHFAHPCYHFQLGGRHMPNEVGYGRLLLLEPPRIAHPPLDAILAIDFVLTNYFPDTWHELRQDEKYTRIIKQAQHRVWYPYAKAATQWEERIGGSTWIASHIWPQLAI